MSKFLNSTEWILWMKCLPGLRLPLPVSKPRTGLLCSSQASRPSQMMVCRCRAAAVLEKLPQGPPRPQACNPWFIDPQGASLERTLAIP